jgi:hypothetical protein
VFLSGLIVLVEYAEDERKQPEKLSKKNMGKFEDLLCGS